MPKPEIAEAVARRQTSTSVLIVGAGGRCADRDAPPNHDRHPAGAVTLTLSEEAARAETGSGAAFYAEPDVEGDITKPLTFAGALARGGVDLVHLENMPLAAIESPQTLANAFARLAPDGTLQADGGGGGKTEAQFEALRGRLVAAKFSGIVFDFQGMHVPKRGAFVVLGFRLAATKVPHQSVARSSAGGVWEV